MNHFISPAHHARVLFALGCTPWYDKPWSQISPLHLPPLRVLDCIYLAMLFSGLTDQRLLGQQPSRGGSEAIMSVDGLRLACQVVV